MLKHPLKNLRVDELEGGVRKWRSLEWESSMKEMLADGST
jgi:hypothetical protein